MKAIALFVIIACVTVLACFAFDRWIFHPVGRYLPCGSTMRRMDTVTGKVEVWWPETAVNPNAAYDRLPPEPYHKAGWVELGK